MQQFDQVYKDTLEEFFRTYEFEPLRGHVWGANRTILEPFFAEFAEETWKTTEEQYLHKWETNPILKFIRKLAETIWKLNAVPRDDWLALQIKKTGYLSWALTVEPGIQPETKKCYFCHHEGVLTKGFYQYPLFDEKCAQKVEHVTQLLRIARILTRAILSAKTLDLEEWYDFFIRDVRQIADEAGVCLAK
jgi:hypothetical protein